MRITEGVMVNNMMNNLQHNMKRLDEYNQQLSSGQKFQHPSEAPIRAAKSMDYSSQIEKSEQFEENVNQARGWLETSERAMDDANHVVQRARELTVQGANDTLTETERQNIAEELVQLREELIGIAETRHGDRYVFSGQRTSEKPFDEEGNYQGDHKNINRQINPGVQMDINVTGEAAFGDSIDALDDVIDDLRGGNARIYSDRLESGSLDPGGDWVGESMEIIIDGDPVIVDELSHDMTRKEFINQVNGAANDDRRYARLRGNQIEFRSYETGEESTIEIDPGGTDDNITEALFGEGEDYHPNDGEVSGGEGSIRLSEEDIATFDEAIEDSLQLRAELGAKINRLDLTERRLEDGIINTRELLSENQDTDMAETIMELRMEESVYQASLATGARVIQPTLVDFLQ